MIKSIKLQKVGFLEETHRNENITYKPFIKILEGEGVNSQSYFLFIHRCIDSYFLDTDKQSAESYVDKDEGIIKIKELIEEKLLSNKEEYDNEVINENVQYITP